MPQEVSNYGTNALCFECSNKGFISNIGTCYRCGKGTSSGALKLCNKCGLETKTCQSCGKPLEVAE